MGTSVCEIWDIIKSYRIDKKELALLLFFFYLQNSEYTAPYTFLWGRKEAFYKQVGNKTATFPRVLELSKSQGGSSIIGESPRHLLLYKGAI